MNSFPTPESGVEPSSPPHGWYPDPASGERLRLWDGQRWTDQVRTVQVEPSPAPVSFRQPESLSTPARARQGPQGTPIDFRGRPIARGEDSRTPVVNPRGPTGGQTADNVPLASWGQRLVATLIDWVVNVVLVAVVLTFAVKDFWTRYLSESSAWADAIVAGQADFMTVPPELLHLGTVMITTAAGVSMVYGVVFLGTWGATLGQKLLKIKVVPFSRGKAKLGWLQAIVRTLMWTLLSHGGSFLLIVQLINVLLPLWQPNKQTIHDLIARTQVVKVVPPPSE